jgi:hypothetical protein
MSPSTLARGVLTCVLLSACGKGTIVVPDAGVVGPAPLRRLTNSQYWNALADVFSLDPAGFDTLPVDAPVGGFDNAAEAQQPSELRVSRSQVVAQQVAERLTTGDAALAALLPCARWATAEEEHTCLAGFLTTTGRRLFRRPLTADEETRVTQRFAQARAQVDFAGAMQLVLESLLQAPQFLYRPEPADGFDGFSVATRLSLLLWDRVPDDTLLDAAAHGALSSPAQVRVQASRLLSDDKALRVFWNFHRQWLGLERILLDEHQVRLPTVDPSWTPATQASALEETRRFVENVMLEDASLHSLLSSPRAWVDAETARLYGVPVPQVPWSPVTLDAAQRAGVLTRIAFLAGTSHRAATSPPIRGNSVNLRLLCRLPTPPPPGVNATPPTMGTEAATNRMLFEQRTAPAACAGCHRTLNGIGFGFEHYSAAGQWQDSEVGLPIDATGALYGTDVDGPFDGGLELSQALARSRQVQDCATTMWVRYALGRSTDPREEPWLEAVKNHFAATGGDVAELLFDIATAPTFLNLPEARP